MACFLHRGGLLIQFSRVNLKLTVITLLGLTIGMSMISAALFQLDSTRADYYFRVFEEKQDDLKFQVHTSGSMSEYTSDTAAEIEEQINSLISEHNLVGTYQLSDFYPYSQISSFRYYNTSMPASTDIYGIAGLNESIIGECVEGSRLPSNLHEVIVFVKNTSAIQLSLNEQFNITETFSEGPGSNLIKHNFTLTAVGLMTPTTLRNTSILYDILSGYHSSSPSYEGFGLITNFTSAFNLAQSMKEELIDLYNYEDGFYCQFYFDYVFDLSAITRDNIVTLKEHIFNFHYALNMFYIYNEPRVNAQSNSYGLYNQIYYFDGLYLLFLLLSSPVFIVVALLVSFSLGFINEKRKQALALLKSRGISNRFVFLMMFIETTLIAITSAMLALFIGIPVALFLGSSTGLLTFTRPIDPFKLVITPGAIQDVFVMSGLLTFLLHLPSLARLSRSTVLSLSEEAGRKKRGKIRVVIGTIDLVLLTLGSAGVILASVLTDLLSATAEGEQALIILFPILGLVLTFSPLLFFTGFMLFVNRFIPTLIQRLGTISWQRDWRFVAIATRNLTVSTKITSRTTVLIATSLALMVAFTIFPLSYQSQTIDNTLYTVGGEVSFSMDRWNEDTFDLLVTELNNITGFSFTVVKEFEVNMYDPYSYSSNFRIMGIEEDFAAFAHWQAYYDDEPLEALVATLFSAEANNSAIIDSKTMVREQLALGNSYTIQSHDLAIPLSIQAVTNYWPRMVSWNLRSFVITKASYLTNLTTTTSGYFDYRNTIIGNILPGQDRPKVITELKAIVAKWRPDEPAYDLSQQLNIIDEFDGFQEDSLTNIFLWFTVNTNILAALVVVLSAIVLFAVTRTLRHTRETALGRSLGMKFPQIFRLIFTETFLLFVVSGLLGGLAGGTLVIGIVSLFGQLSAPPAPVVPFMLQINLVLIIGYYLLVFFVTLAVGLLSSLITTRANISKILKVE
ncbi:MAG: FtsX-like permease family protein [Promethearchaeota archaeon]